MSCATMRALNHYNLNSYSPLAKEPDGSLKIKREWAPHAVTPVGVASAGAG